jgi:hypothetical protein
MTDTGGPKNTDPKDTDPYLQQCGNQTKAYPDPGLTLSSQKVGFWQDKYRTVYFMVYVR